ncbi:sigma-70 family RNA polymerase sigma factor [Metabacillus sp. GX 13764]|uniref:sigma-70 family RNA polymerase sigma factor n=1 Tax=Metabacillus kandeliae TaxID=2900151 RepID=UPI001E3B2039|nr:sigma-70 family RNA polymerase sigma factor [Metabacillus kandeliae]MCD7035537.1 sigma-70 family RNA polymerase sigma factor [Metabacillus kandeliae]
MNDGKLTNEEKKADKNEYLNQLMSQYGDELSYLVYSYVKDIETAKDLVQNSFVAAYLQLDNFEGRSSARTWLYRIAINKCKDHLKSAAYKKMRLTGELPELIDLDKSPAETAERKAQSAAIKRAVFRLPLKYREIIVMMYYQELTIKEIAEILKIPEASVRTRLRRAKQKLEPLLKKEGAAE